MNTAETEFDLGNKCVIQRKFKDAIAHYKKSAQNGYADAQYNLGFCYSHGIGVKQNYLDAIIWYNKAIANGLSQAEDLLNELKTHGDAVAQYNLGSCYAKGYGVTQDYKQAVCWFTLAAKQGHVNAQLALGEAYYSGYGVTRDYRQEVYWYTKAAEQGHTDAQYFLGGHYEQGRGVTQDYEQAVYWYTKAAEQGHIDAQYDLGRCYEQGHGVTQNYEQAVYWYTKASDQGHAMAKCFLEKNTKPRENQNIIRHELLIERDTDYSRLLLSMEKFSFSIIRNYASKKCSFDDDRLWASLNRGRAVLDREEQMYKYIYSYGNMHRAKLEKAFSYITKGVFANSKIEIIDYACGQGLASVCFKDYFQNVNVEHITLIEPSTICLRRAALHVLKSYSINEKNISTINKYLDDLTSQDIYTNDGNIKVHLFSNILDMADDKFSLNGLVDLIKNKFSGVNYFICVSPYIDDSVPERFNTFSDSFDNVILGNIAFQSGNWINNWTIVLRVFKVELKL